MAGPHAQRPRRVASSRQTRLLRLAGWRYSITRDAWVLRAFGGRVGPVFVNPDATAWPSAAHPTPLDATEVPTPAAAPRTGEKPRLIVSTDASLRPGHGVYIRLTDQDEPRVIVVDGQPPRAETTRNGA